MNEEREERMSSWMDGLLTPEEAQEFEAEMAADPALAARVARWKSNDRFIADAFAPYAERPVDAASLGGPGLRLDPEPADEIMAANDNSPWWRRRGTLLSGSLAASLVALVILGQRSEPVANGDLSTALETTSAFQEAKLADGRVVTPFLTVQARDGRWCREFSVDRGARGLACREDGSWKLVATADHDEGPRSSGISLAAGPDDRSLEIAYMRLGVSDPVGPTEERALIASGWKR